MTDEKQTPAKPEPIGSGLPVSEFETLTAAEQHARREKFWAERGPNVNAEKARGK